jgi:phage shock protein E
MMPWFQQSLPNLKTTANEKTTVRLSMKQLLTSISLFIMMFISVTSFADTLWIDVRSPKEYAADHIDGDINISFINIANEIGKYAPDKNTDIQLYCKSGGRAGAALLQLTAMGYKNAHNAGGIDDVRKIRHTKP